MTIITTAYYDRKLNSIDGLFTIRSIDQQNQKVIKEFVRIPSRSGQIQEANSSWVRRKSPIPFSSEIRGRYKLWLTNPKQYRQWAGTKGIGSFYAISTEDDRETILSEDGLSKRTFAGWHPENLLVGTQCCIASLAETEAQRTVIENVWDYFDYLAKQKQEYIYLDVL